MNGLSIGSSGGCAGKPLLALALGQCFERQERHSGFIKPADALPPMPGEPPASGRCRPVACEEAFMGGGRPRPSAAGCWAELPALG